MAQQCQGYIRKGGAFSFGPVTWYQCKNRAVVLIKFTQDNDGEPEGELPACLDCWERARRDKHITIVEVKPIPEEVQV